MEGRKETFNLGWKIAFILPYFEGKLRERCNQAKLVHSELEKVI